MKDTAQFSLEDVISLVDVLLVEAREAVAIVCDDVPQIEFKTPMSVLFAV
jgi:hypothetical protein